MSDKVYLGLKVGTLETAETLPQVSRINLSIDSGNMYTSGTDEGRTIEAYVPWGTQAMADHILAGMKNVTYRPYTAEQALLEPAAEIGDGITVGGIYSAIYQTGISFDRQMTATVSAPTSDETEDEFPYQSKAQREASRKLAQTRSLITKTAEQIRLEVSDEVEGLDASISVELESITARVEGAEDSIEVAIDTLDGLTVTDSSGTTRIKGDSVETGTLYVSAANITGTLTADQIELTGAISWPDLATDAQNQVISAYNLANTANNTASNVSNTVSAWQYGGTTYIDGTKLMTGTVYASYLKGGSIGILNSSGAQIGYITVGTSTSTGIQLVSAGNLYLASSGCNITMSGNSMAIASCQYLYPNGTASYLGYPGLGMWQAVYSYTGTIQTSDRNMKHDIEALPDKYLDMLMELPVCRFKLDTGTSDRYHVGYIAQDVEDYMAKHGIDSLEFGGFVKDAAAAGNDVYMLRYEEFIAMHTLAVQRHKEKIEVMGAEIENLKGRLEAAGL